MPESDFHSDEITSNRPEPQNSSKRDNLLSRRMTRRKLLGKTAVGVAGIALLAACGPDGKPLSADDSLDTTPASPTAVPESTPTPEKEPQTLREWAEKAKFNIGITVGSNGFPEHFKAMSDFQAKEFNLAHITTNMQFTQPKEGEFSFTNSDFITNLAKRNNMKTYGTLVWSSDLPPWMKGKNSLEDLSRIRKAHIKALMERYKGRMDTWNVINEYGKKGDIFLEKEGPGYLEDSFRLAREADPSAKLIYNDYDNHSRTNTVFGTNRYNITKEVVDRLKANGLIDGVGLQMHLDGANPPQKEDVMETMKSYGVPVWITEFDVNLRNVPGSDEDRYNRQAEIYRSMLEAAIESGVCKDFIVFQMVDYQSVWENRKDLPGYSTKADPTPYDDNMQPKPAYHAMIEALKSGVTKAKAP